MATTRSGDRVSRCRAFSLIELVVVAAILALLAGLVLAGVQSARESARRMHCASNLRQLGVGLMLHHEARGALPPSWGGPDSTATQVWGSPPTAKPYPGPGVGEASGFVMLLPYIGEEALSARIEAAGWPFIFDQMYTAARVHMLLCPSDISPRSHNYLFSIGDRFRGFWPGFTVPPAENTRFQSALRGLFGLQSCVRLDSVRDGLSNTIAMSECVRPRGLGRVVPPGTSEDGLTYADGAVRFIGDSIDAGDPNLPDRPTGPSPYGVWGALGSRAGGEVVSIPES